MKLKSLNFSLIKFIKSKNHWFYQIKGLFRRK